MATTQYIGARYVPLFADPAEWNNTRTYEPLTIVMHEGNSFTSKQYVPKGIDITNEDYWALTGNYNAQVEQYRKDVNQFKSLVNDTIVPEVNEIKAKYVKNFNTVSEMKTAQLDAGMVCHTNGFNTLNDGGASWYTIIDSANANEMDVIACGNTYAKLLNESNLICPEQFGARADGKTDDTKALQRCVDYAKENTLTVQLNSKDYVVSETINVKSCVNIQGISQHEKRPSILTDVVLNPVLNFEGVINTIKGFDISSKSGKHMSGSVGIIFNGNDSGHVDSKAIDCHVCYIETGCIVKGRNVNFYDCGFSHNKYGIYYEFPAGLSAIRGNVIDRCRFHGIGEDIEFNSSAIYMKNNTQSNLTITNCMCDQGGTFFTGYATEGLISGCFIELWEKPAIVMESDPENPILHPNNIGSWNITGNKFVGKKGQDAIGNLHSNYPETLIRIANYGRVAINGNSFSKCQKAAIELKSFREGSVTNNSFASVCINNQSSSDQTIGAIALNNCLYTAIANNTLLDTSYQMPIAYKVENDSSHVSIFNNWNFLAPIDINFLPIGKMFTTSYGGKFGSSIDVNIKAYSEFTIRRTDGASSWYCSRIGNYITSTPYIHGTSLDYLTWDMSAERPLPTLNRFNMETNAITQLAVDFVIILPC